MSSLQELIKKIQVGTVSSESYIYYDKSNGKIYKISGKNIPDDNYAIFAIPSEEVKSILSGERRIDEFVIFYDLSSKQIRLKEVAYEDNHKTASTMCYQLPVIKNSHDGHLALTQVYEGVDIYIWDQLHSYNSGQHVWYNGDVYKLGSDTIANAEFNLAHHALFVKDVALTKVSTQTHSATKLVMTPEYVGVHVDVWYKELSHLAGQHVWLNNAVYKLIADQDIDTEFTIDNAELIISNVKLYADENPSLKKISSVTAGDIILNNNSIYSINVLEETFTKDKSSIFFHNTPSTPLYVNDDSCLKVDLNSMHEDVDFKNIKLNLTPVPDLKNGQIILSGKQLYQVQIDKEYDVIVQQNSISKTWNIILNPYTKKFLLTSGYRPGEILYFSVTSKYDPNVLYRSLEFSVADLLSENSAVIPFKYAAEGNINEVSIYTAKYFESYAHESI